EARPYALTTLFAVAATYLLVRAAKDRRWPWWTSYAVAIILTALFNLFALLLVAAHGLTLLAARPRPGSTPASSLLAAPAASSSPVVAPASAVDFGGRAGASAGMGPAADPGRDRPAGQQLLDGAPARWLVACGAAAVLLAPVAVLSLR